MTSPENQSGRKPGTRYVASDKGKDREPPRFVPHPRDTIDRPRFIVDATEDRAGESRGIAPTEFTRSSLENVPAQGEISQETPGSPSAEVVSPPEWRNLVSAKVSRYKSRRARPERYPSLQLKFEPKPSAHETRPEVGERSSGPHCSPSGAAVPDLDPRPREFEAPRPPEATARVLEFPRWLAVPVRRDELAEPIIDRPRILEAPELLPPPPAMGGILIEPSEQSEPERRPGFDIPLASAALGRRLTAGLIDGLMVMVAIATFGCVFLRVIDAAPTWKTVYELALGLVAGLWPTYQFVFLVFSGTTPGLSLCRLRIERFDGTPAGRKLRGCRVLVSLLSAVSIGIGYLWCFLDEDQLSWHDHITSTHVADPRKSAPASRPN